MVPVSTPAVFLLKACSPCCDDCPALLLEGDEVVIRDEAEPARGWVRLPKAELLAFLSDPVVQQTAISPPVHAEIRVGAVEIRFLQGEPWGAHVLFVHGGRNVVFLLDEWRASLASSDWVDRLRERLAA